MNCDQAVNGADIDAFFAWLAGNIVPDCNANGIPDDCEGIGPLAIVTQPQSTFACVGDTVTLSVETSSFPLTVQWRKNGNPIAGATFRQLRFSQVQLSDAADYDVIVGDACVSLTSDIATLTVHTPPSINTQPRSQNICIGAPLVLLVGATGPALTYQWRKDGTDIPGATDPTYIVAAVSESDAGEYRVVVANSCGTVWSDLASVTILTTILTHQMPSWPSTTPSGRAPASSSPRPPPSRPRRTAGSGTPGIYTDQQGEAWKQVVDAVRERGSRIFLQLWHTGRASHSDFLGGELPVAPSAIRINGKGVRTPLGKKPHETPRALDTKELPGIVADYVAATKRAPSRLLEVAREMRLARERGEPHRLSDHEIAVYDAVPVNDSGVTVLGDGTLRKIARELVDAARQSVMIALTEGESARGRIRVIVKRILRKHG